MYYDLFVAGLLVMLSLLLLPAWKHLGGGSDLGVADLLASSMLPAAMGFLLAFRYGTVDLSIWVTRSLGGLVGAGLIHVGFSPALAVVGALLVGAAMGGINALLLSWIRLPGWAVTAAVALIVLVGLSASIDQRQVQVPFDTFDDWVKSISDTMGVRPEENLLGPLLTIRMLIGFGAWAGVLLALMVADSLTPNTPRPFARWWVRSVSLIASGILAATSGICWLIDLGHTPVPSRLIDSFLIPVAVLLAGAMILQGRGRTMLAGIFLPMGLLLAFIWKQMILPITVAGYSVSLVLLGLMTVVAHYAWMWGLDHSRRGRILAWSAAALVLGAIGLVGYSAGMDFRDQALARRIIYVGLGAWGVGSALLGLSMLLERLHGDDQPLTEEEQEDLQDEDLIVDEIDEGSADGKA
jgi:hypothetical protein